VSKAKQSSPIGGGEGGQAGPADGDVATTAESGNGGGGVGASVEQLKTKAQQNPVPTAAVAAFIGGVACGRLIGRR